MSQTQVQHVQEIELQSRQSRLTLSSTTSVDDEHGGSSAPPSATPSGAAILPDPAVLSSQVAAAGADESVPPPGPVTGVLPEGGYGWVVIAACSIANFFFAGSSYSFGIIQSQLVTDGLAPPSTLAFVGSLAVACLSIFALINSNLIRRFGCKTILALGGVLAGMGELVASFCTKSVAGLFLSFGVMTGVGYSMIYMTSATLPAQYFLRRRGLANGLVNAAGGVGGGVIALALAVLIQKVGTVWCLRILGFATIGFVVPAAMLVKELNPKRSKAAVEWRLFRDPRFLTIFIATGLGTFPLMVPPFFLPLYGKQLGLPTFSSAALVSGFNLSSALGRVAFGQLADLIGPVNALILAMSLSGFALLVLWPISTTLAPLIVFVMVSGISAGAFFSLMPTVIASLTDPAVMTSGLGLLVTGWGAGYLLGPPIAGYLLQAGGGETRGISAYRPAAYYAGSVTLASMLMVVAMKLKTTKSLSKRM